MFFNDFFLYFNYSIIYKRLRRILMKFFVAKNTRKYSR